MIVTVYIFEIIMSKSFAGENKFDILTYILVSGFSIIV